MKMSLSKMISKVNKLEISTLKNLTRKCSTNFLTWIKIEFEIDRSLDKNQWVNFKRYFMFRNSKMSRHYEAFGTSVTRIWSVVLLLFLFFQVAQGAMEAKKDAHTWDFKSLMFEKTRLL